MTQDRTQGGAQSSSDGLDHGRTLEFGFFIDPAADKPAAVLDTARLLDRLGYDLIITDVAPAVRQHVAEVRALSPHEA
jgi:hypothetical protein